MKCNFNKFIIGAIFIFVFNATADSQFRERSYSYRHLVKFDGTNIVSGLINKEMSLLEDGAAGISSAEIDTRVNYLRRMLNITDLEWKMFVREQNLLRITFVWYLDFGMGFGMEKTPFFVKTQNGVVFFENEYLGVPERELLDLIRDNNDAISMVSAQMRHDLLLGKDDDNAMKIKGVRLLQKLETQWNTVQGQILIEGKPLSQILETNGTYHDTFFRIDEMDSKTHRKWGVAAQEASESSRELSDALKFKRIEWDLSAIFSKWIVEDMPMYEGRLEILHDACVKKAKLHTSLMLLRERSGRGVRVPALVNPDF